VLQIRVSPRASSDLIEIWSYIADDSVANADAFIDKLYQKIQAPANQLCAFCTVQGTLRVFLKIEESSYRPVAKTSPRD
jgi:plasmid stabilization system protein ParE